MDFLVPNGHKIVNNKGVEKSKILMKYIVQGEL
jgi:hypothetical protein